MQRFDDWGCLFLAYSPTILIAHVPSLAFNFVQATNRVQRLFSQLAFVRHMQIEKLATGVGHAANFDDAFLETGFVASEIVAYQLAVPLPKEVARMLACTTGTEVINHSLERRKRRGAVGPDVSAVSFLLAWREHLNRSLIGVDPELNIPQSWRERFLQASIGSARLADGPYAALAEDEMARLEKQGVAHDKRG